MTKDVFIFSKELIDKVKVDAPKYYIGLDDDGKRYSYCLGQKFSDGPMIVILAKTFTDKKAWKEEVSNLQKYFNATINE